MEKTVKVMWLLDEEGRKANLLDKGDGKYIQEGALELSEKTLELAKVSSNGEAKIYCGFYIRKDGRVGSVVGDYRLSYDGFSYYKKDIAVEHSTNIPAMEAYQAEVIRRQKLQTKKEKLEKEIEENEKKAYAEKLQQIKDEGPPSLVTYRNQRDPMHGIWRNVYSTNTLLEKFKDGLSEDFIEAAYDIVQQKNEEAVESHKRDEAREEEREKGRQRKKDAYRIEAKRWIDKFGSPRLRKAVELDLLEESLTVYFEERLKKEWPGWRRYDAHEWNDIHNPSLEALELLGEARKKDKTAQLRWVEWEEVEEDYCGPGSGRWGPVVVAEFLGKLILREVSVGD